MSRMEKYHHEHHIDWGISTIEFGLWLLLLSPITYGLKDVLTFASVDLNMSFILAVLIDTLFVVNYVHIRID